MPINAQQGALIRKKFQPLEKRSIYLDDVGSTAPRIDFLSNLGFSTAEYNFNFWFKLGSPATTEHPLIGSNSESSYIGVTVAINATLIYVIYGDGTGEGNGDRLLYSINHGISDLTSWNHLSINLAQAPTNSPTIRINNTIETALTYATGSGWTPAYSSAQYRLGYDPQFPLDPYSNVYFYDFRGYTSLLNTSDQNTVYAFGVLGTEAVRISGEYYQGLSLKDESGNGRNGNIISAIQSRVCVTDPTAPHSFSNQYGYSTRTASFPPEIIPGVIPANGLDFEGNTLQFKT